MRESPSDVGSGREAIEKAAALSPDLILRALRPRARSLRARSDGLSTQARLQGQAGALVARGREIGKYCSALVILEPFAILDAAAFLSPKGAYASAAEARSRRPTLERRGGVSLSSRRRYGSSPNSRRRGPRRFPPT
jgi:hypothetical protein